MFFAASQKIDNKNYKTVSKKLYLDEWAVGVQGNRFFDQGVLSSNYCCPRSYYSRFRFGFQDLVNLIRRLDSHWMVLPLQFRP